MQMHLDHSPRQAACLGAPRLRHGSTPGWLAVIGAWIERARQRRALARLDDHLLRDVGISRDQVEAEATQPFWRR